MILNVTHLFYETNTKVKKYFLIKPPVLFYILHHKDQNDKDKEEKLYEKIGHKQKNVDVSCKQSSLFD